MPETMETLDQDATSAAAGDDLSPLAWVYGELRRSLETAHKALRRYVKEAEATSGSDLDSVDPAVLRIARTHLHQGVGALELVGMPAAADVLRASEAAVQRMASRPAMLDAAAVETVERVSFALLDYLARQLARKPVSPVMLFPQYRAVQQLAAAERIHPADLWKIDWQWRELATDPRATPRSANDQARTAMETQVLALMRQGSGESAREALMRMSDLCADLGAGARETSFGGPRVATFWQLASAVFEAQAGGLLNADVYSKRLASGMLHQLRQQVRGFKDVSDRQCQDLLFFCSHASAPTAARPAPRLTAARQAWHLEDLPTADYETPRLGRFDPAVMALARKRVAAAKDSWSAVAGGELHRMGGLPEQFSLMGESLQRLLPDGEVLARALQSAVTQTVTSNAPPPPALAMEVATGILYLDASLEDAEFDHPELAERVNRLARRIDDVRIGADPQPLDTWMEELYRRVSDRQTMGSVVQELRSSLSEIEKQIDQYFREPARRELLIPVPGQLSAMRGVLSVLGMDQASQACLHMRDDVEALAQTEVDPQLAIRAGTFDRLADNLGALSFLIDMLSVQPQLAKSLFRFDPETGSLSAVMGQSERVSAFAAFDAVPDVPAPPRPHQDAGLRIPGLVPPPQGEPSAPPSTLPASASGLEDDAEMREIFIEEALEVITEARAALERLADAPDSAGDLTAVRRAFHTLKGSSRMVGLREFGDASWACEQLYNDRLATTPRMDGPLRALTSEALDYLGDWTQAIAAGQAAGHSAADVALAADALRLQGVRLPMAKPAIVPVPAAEAPAVEELAAPTLALPPLTPDELEVTEIIVAADAPGSPFEATETLSPPSPAPAPAMADLLDLDFDLQELSLRPEDLDAASVPPTVALDPLTVRIPDLPSAADLDLGLRDVTVPEVPATDLNFDLELNAFGDAEPEVKAPPPHPPVSTSLLDLPLEALPPPAAATPTPPAVEALEIDFGEFDDVFGDAPAAAAPELAAADVPPAQPAPPLEPAPPDDGDDEQVKLIGPLRISIPLFNIYLNEADELSRRLVTELAEWALEHERHPVPDSSVALAHSLAGSSATVGYGDLSALARALEHALMRSHAQGPGRPGEAALFNDAADEVRRLLHQFAAGFLRSVAPELMDRLAAHERLVPGAEPLLDEFALEAPETPVPPEAGFEAQPAAADTDGIDAVDAIDTELFPIFEEEADELLPQLQTRLRDWLGRPAEDDAAMACMRTLHTLKGGARLAGAMRMGEMAHRLETAIEALGVRGNPQAADIEPLLATADAMSAALDGLRRRGTRASPPVPPPIAPPIAPQPVAAPTVPAAEAVAADAVAPPTPEAPATGPTPEPLAAAAAAAAAAPPVVTAPVAIDWSRFGSAEATPVAAADRPAPGGAVVRVRAGLLDRLVSQAGEVSITRARLDSDVKLMQTSLGDLTESLERMRRQLRDIELQAETQITTRIEAAKAAAQAFDPLEMDRFTRFQELTRFMAESVNDVATLQRSLQRTLQSTEDELAAQARLTRELQDDLLRTRMVEFESISDRLYRTARQAAKETGKQVKVDIVGGGIEIDRGVLERMAGPFEHLLRNSVAHGIESSEARALAGKDATGTITITVAQAGNEVGVEFGDDGGGLDLPRIRRRAEERGLLAADAAASDAELAAMIFAPGFSTAEAITELAGRGVGLDVVRAEVNAMGGRVETASQPGHGTRFKLLLPLTTAVTQVVMLRCGDLQVAVPSPLIEIVRRAPSADVEKAYASGHFEYGGESLPFFWLAALLRAGSRGEVMGRTQMVVVIRSAAQRVVIHVDEVVGNQEVVVKNVGPQLARLPGLAGVTLLPSGAVALIYNPVALASLYGDEARERMRLGVPLHDRPQAEAMPVRAPMVLVVDDSLTVRRVTQRLLVREGYRVVLAKDGLEALERLAEERPVVLLTDIEMPRMDGFDLVRNVRADPVLANLPVVMITSRIAQKHREYAAELGVQHYLGKPYSEEEMLSLVARYAGADIPS